MIFSVPSKTFILGEYGVLKNTPALLVNTGPRFELTAEINPSKNGTCTGISEIGPAQVFYKTHQDFFSQYDLAFKDPWQGTGGFGASSAQFGLLHCLRYLWTQSDLAHAEFKDLQKLRSTYRDMAWLGRGFPPSGADVVSQWIGGLCHVDFSNQVAERLTWPFSDLSFALIKTNRKQPTHQHLEALGTIPDKEFDLIAKRGVTALKNKDPRNFVLAVKANYQLLSREGLVALDTQELIDKANGTNLILAAKGCGAMGADVVFVVLETRNQFKFKNWCEELGLRMVATQYNISSGIEIAGVQSENLVSLSTV